MHRCWCSSLAGQSSIGQQQQVGLGALGLLGQQQIQGQGLQIGTGLQSGQQGLQLGTAFQGKGVWLGENSHRMLPTSNRWLLQ